MAADIYGPGRQKRGHKKNLIARARPYRVKDGTILEFCVGQEGLPAPQAHNVYVAVVVQLSTAKGTR